LKATFEECLVQITAQSKDSFDQVTQSSCIGIFAVPCAALSVFLEPFVTCMAPTCNYTSPVALLLTCLGWNAHIFCLTTPSQCCRILAYCCLVHLHLDCRRTNN